MSYTFLFIFSFLKIALKSHLLTPNILFRQDFIQRKLFKIVLQHQQVSYCQEAREIKFRFTIRVLTLLAHLASPRSFSTSPIHLYLAFRYFLGDDIVFRVRKYLRQLQPDECMLFYFPGFGIQDV